MHFTVSVSNKRHDVNEKEERFLIQVTDSLPVVIQMRILTDICSKTEKQKVDLFQFKDKQEVNGLKADI